MYFPYFDSSKSIKPLNPHSQPIPPRRITFGLLYKSFHPTTSTTLYQQTWAGLGPPWIRLLLKGLQQLKASSTLMIAMNAIFSVFFSSVPISSSPVMDWNLGRQLKGKGRPSWHSLLQILPGQEKGWLGQQAAVVMPSFSNRFMASWMFSKVALQQGSVLVYVHQRMCCAERGSFSYSQRPTAFPTICASSLAQAQPAQMPSVCRLQVAYLRSQF